MKYLYMLFSTPIIQCLCGIGVLAQVITYKITHLTPDQYDFIVVIWIVLGACMLVTGIYSIISKLSEGVK